MSSNDFTQVRDYIKTRMAVVEPDFIEWKNSLNDIGNIPQTILDKTYHINLAGVTSRSNIDHHVEDDISVVITVFRRGYNEPVEARDALFQTANCIRLDLISPLNIEEYKLANDGNIEDVQSLGMSPSEIDATNDNIVKIEIELNVRLFQAT